jgi:hypothetical protein
MAARSPATLVPAVAAVVAAVLAVATKTFSIRAKICCSFVLNA